MEAYKKCSFWWSCPFCNKSFNYVSQLFEHCQKDHEEEKTIMSINEQTETNIDLNQAWYDEESTGPIEVPEFEALLNEMHEQDQKIKALKADTKDENAILTKMKTKVLAYFEEFGKTKHIASFGTVYMQTNFTCKTPKTPEEKAALFAWMKEKEIYEQYATVNSRSLNSLYNSLIKEDSDFIMPGTSDPGYYQTIEMRRT